VHRVLVGKLVSFLVGLRTYQPPLVCVFIKASRNRPGVSQKVPGGLGSQISMILGT
jgi:hypothetical protein